MPDIEPRDSDLYDYAGKWLALIDTQRPGESIRLDAQMQRSILQRLRELIDAERKRKARPAHRPRASDIGEMVEARIAEGLNQTEARRAVVKQTGKSPKAVALAHQRRGKNNPVVVHRRPK